MYVSFEDFEQAAKTLRKLHAEERAFILVSGLVDELVVRFELPGDAPEITGIRENEPLMLDLTDALGAAVVTSEENFLSVRQDEDRFSGHDEWAGQTEAPEVASRKWALVTELFDIDQLRFRRWLKRTAKQPELGVFEWDVAKKLSDDDIRIPSVGEVPFATLRVSGNYASPSRIGERTPPVHTVLTLDIEDVNAMLATLTRLRKALRADRADVHSDGTPKDQ